MRRWSWNGTRPTNGGQAESLGIPLATLDTHSDSRKKMQTCHFTVFVTVFTWWIIPLILSRLVHPIFSVEIHPTYPTHITTDIIYLRSVGWSATQDASAVKTGLVPPQFSSRLCSSGDFEQEEGGTTGQIFPWYVQKIMALDCRTVECYGMFIIRSLRPCSQNLTLSTEYVGMFCSCEQRGPA